MSSPRYSSDLLKRAASIVKKANGEALDQTELLEILDRLADAYENSMNHIRRFAESPEALFKHSLAYTDRLRELFPDEDDMDWLRLILSESGTLARLGVAMVDSMTPSAITPPHPRTEA